MDRLLLRLKEPSTYAGIALAITGAGQVFNISGAPDVASTVAAGGQVAVETGNPWLAGIAILGGLVAMFTGEKGKG